MVGASGPGGSRRGLNDDGASVVLHSGAAIMLVGRHVTAPLIFDQTATTGVSTKSGFPKASGLWRRFGGSASNLPAPDDVASLWLRVQTGCSDIKIARRASGRPRLTPPYAELGVSLSSRADLLAVGFAPDRAVGCDIEVDDPTLDPAGLARDHFSAGEGNAVAGLDAAAARDLFLRLWVAKEAALKLSGRGVFDGMDEPDLGQHIEQLSVDGQQIDVGAGHRTPRHSVVVARLQRPGAGQLVFYCGLACARS